MSLNGNTDSFFPLISPGQALLLGPALSSGTPLVCPATGDSGEPGMKLLRFYNFMY